LTGHREEATAVGEAAAALVKGTPLDWLDRDPASKAARLKAMDGWDLLVSVHIEPKNNTGDVDDQSTIVIDGLRCLS
jgi:hypothetical protein